MQLPVCVIILIGLFATVPVAVYGAPGDECFEQYDGDLCGFLEGPLDALIEPFLSVFGVWFFPIVWGTILGILWIRTQNTMLVGIIGVMISTLITSFYEPARGIGIILFVIAMGITVYQLFITRLTTPTQG